MDDFIRGLIWLLVYALGVGIACYIVARLARQFVPGFSDYVWIVWCIGGLVLLLLALRLFGPLLS